MQPDLLGHKVPWVHKDHQVSLERLDPLVLVESLERLDPKEHKDLLELLESPVLKVLPE